MCTDRYIDTDVFDSGVRVPGEGTAVYSRQSAGQEMPLKSILGRHWTFGGSISL